MKRHHLFILLLSMVIGLATARPLHEGSDYKKLSKLFPSVYPNKIEVVEIFAYNCFHCQHFEPLVEDFAKKLDPNKVVLRKIHVYWGPIFMNLVRLNIAVQESHLGNQADPLIFDAIIRQHLQLNNEKTLLNWLNKQTTFDGKKVATIFNKPTIKKQAEKEAQLSSVFGIDATPTFIVDGRYQLILDSLHDENDLQKSLNSLIDLAKREKKPIPLVENSGAQLCADSL